MNKEFWKATGIRLIRTFLTTILGVWTADKTIMEIDWRATLIAAISATIYIFILCILAGLPEVKLADTLESLDNYPYDEEELDIMEFDEEGDE